MTSYNFVKMHGLGNDFVIIDNRQENKIFSKAFILALSDRYKGVGYDQLVVMEKPTDKSADVKIRIWNKDATQVEACGNATRCVAKLICEEKKINGCVIQIDNRLLHAFKKDEENFSVNMGPAIVSWKDIPLASEVSYNPSWGNIPNLKASYILNIGNPHLVLFFSTLHLLDVKYYGKKLSEDPFFPKGINIEFAEVIEKDVIQCYIWERGVGITKACGTGACAVFYAGHILNYCSKEALICMPGGKLTITLDDEKNEKTKEKEWHTEEAKTPTPTYKPYKM